MRQDGSACVKQRSRLCTFLAVLCICVSLSTCSARHLMPLSERVDIDTIPDADDGDPRNRATVQALFQTIRDEASADSAFPAPVAPPPPAELQFQIVKGARGLEVLPLAKPPVYYGPPPSNSSTIMSPSPVDPGFQAPSNETIPVIPTPSPEKTDQPFGLPPGLPIVPEDTTPTPITTPTGEDPSTLNGDFYNPDGSLRVAPPPPSLNKNTLSSIDLGVTSGGQSLKGAPLAMVIVSTIAAFALLAGMALSYYLVAGNRIELEGSEHSETSAGRSPSGDVSPEIYPGFVASERPSARSQSLDEDHNRTTSGRLVSSFLRAMPLRGLAPGPRAGQQFTIYNNDAAEHPVLLNPSELNRINRAAAAVAHIKTLQAAAKSPRRFRGAGPSTIETRTPTNLTMETQSPSHAQFALV